MELASVILVWLAYLLYAAAFAVFLIGFVTQRPWTNALGRWVAAAALAAQAVGLVLRGVEAGHFRSPASTSPRSCSPAPSRSSGRWPSR